MTPSAATRAYYRNTWIVWYLSDEGDPQFPVLTTASLTRAEAISKWDEGWDYRRLRARRFRYKNMRRRGELKALKSHISPNWITADEVDAA